MLRVAGLVAGLLALAAIVAMAVHRAAPRIEAELAARASVALVTAGIDWARVAADGRTLTLTGTAPDDASRDRAVATVSAVPGVLVVNRNFGRMPPPAASEPGPGLVVVHDGDGTRLEGVVPDSDTAGRLVTQARATFPDDPVAEQLDVAAGSSGLPAAAALGTLPALTYLEHGRIRVSGNTVTLEGLAPSPAGRDRARDTFSRAIPADMTGRITLKVPQPPQSAQTCQAALNEIMSDRVRFAPNEAAILPASHDLLDQVTRVILACPGLDIAIGAHTDSNGDEPDNVALTQQRADEVLDYLVEAGVPAGRLAARGYGSSQPLPGNAGRKANRRVEFIVQPGST